MKTEAVNKTKGMCAEQTALGGGGRRASHLGAVVKPPEEGQSSGVARPNYRSQISRFPSDGYNRHGEIYALHWT